MTKRVWGARVRRLQQHFFDLLPCQPVAQCAPKVQGKLVVVAASDERCEGDHRTAATVQTRPRPDCAPGEFGNDPLKVLGEVGGPGVRLLDIAVAEHFAARGHAFVVTAIGHLVPNLLNFASTSAIRSGCSAGAR